MTRRSVLLLLLATGLGLGAAAGAPSSASPRPTGWVEVDFAGPLGAGQRAALEAAGASAVQPAHGSTYLAFAPGAGLRVPGATRVRALTPADKGWSSFASLAGLQPAIVLAHASMPLEREFGRLGGQVRAAFPMSAGGEVVAVTGRIDVRRLSTLAGRRDVLHVAPISLRLEPEDEASAQIMTGGMDKAMEPLPGYRGFLQRHGVTGKGVKVTVVDDGIDSGHPELSGRVTLVARNPEPPQGHGTHVAGIIGGRGVQLAPGIEAKDGAGRLYGVGVAPDVTFIDINEITLVNTLFFDFPPDDGFGTLTRAALQLGSALWNASWHTGEGTGVGYIANAAVMDGLARDGDAARPGNQPFTLVFSAGNAGGAPSTITSPKEAKNIILIASSQNARASYVGAKGRPDRISGFSSRGPARDGRIGITVTAPGENVVSARARMGALCTTDPPLDAGAPFYSLCSGTSMAAPHATGAVALLTEQWRAQHGGTSPSPAMAKALLVNTAQDIGERDIPNGNEGWGRIDLAALLDRAAKRVTVDQSVRLDRVGQSYGLRVAPVDPRRPMKVTLVWTDAPGKPQAPTTRTGKNNKPALVNDLDLTLVGGEGTYRGNRFIDGVSVVGGARDRLENVENVFVQRPSPRGYDLRIRATALPGDGVPGVGNRNDQDFALVLSNARLVR